MYVCVSAFDNICYTSLFLILLFNYQSPNYNFVVRGRDLGLENDGNTERPRPEHGTLAV